MPNPKVSTLTDDDKAVPAKAPLKPVVVAKADVDVLGALAAETAGEDGEGDAEPEAAEALTAATERSRADAVVTDGTWSIQVGAFNTQADAQRRLDEAVKAGVDGLAGKKGITLTHSKDDTVIYRARFAGFDRATARSACAALSRKSITCYALAP